MIRNFLYRPAWKIARGYFDRYSAEIWDDATCDFFEDAAREWEASLAEYRRECYSKQRTARFMGIHPWDWFDLQIPYPPAPVPGHVSREAVLEQLTMIDLLKYFSLPYRDGYNKIVISCPFHREKTPSLSVDTTSQRWYCFGEGRGGDTLAFIQEMEECAFVHALKVGAQIAGLT